MNLHVIELINSAIVVADIEELDDKRAGDLIMAARNICWFNEM